MLVIHLYNPHPATATPLSRHIALMLGLLYQYAVSKSKCLFSSSGSVHTTGHVPEYRIYSCSRRACARWKSPLYRWATRIDRSACRIESTDLVAKLSEIRALRTPSAVSSDSKEALDVAWMHAFLIGHTSQDCPVSNFWHRHMFALIFPITRGWSSMSSCLRVCCLNWNVARS